MIIKYKHTAKTPVYLHDMIVHKITCLKDAIHLQIENESVSKLQPYRHVNMTIEKVDWDYSGIFLLSRKGQCGNFRGCKLPFKQFLKEYKGYSLEISSELHGYGEITYTAWAQLPRRKEPVEMILSICYDGNILYEVYK